MHAATIRISSRRQLAGAAPRRFASTTTSTAQAQASAVASASAVKAKETATLAANKAMEILAKSGQTLTRLATTTGGRTGSLLKAVESAVPPTIYYSKVALELSKLVFRGQKMTPPDMATFQSTISAFVKQQNFVASTRKAFDSLRAASPKELATLGVLSLEVLGFFTVGEMVGRRKLVGYRAQTGAHH